MMQFLLKSAALWSGVPAGFSPLVPRLPQTVQATVKFYAACNSALIGLMPANFSRACSTSHKSTACCIRSQLSGVVFSSLAARAAISGVMERFKCNSDLI